MEFSKAFIKRLNLWFFLIPSSICLLGCDLQKGNDFSKAESLSSSASQQKYFINVDKKELKLVSERGLVFYKNKPFTGYALTYYGNKNIAERIPYVLGRKEGKVERWFDTGKKSFEAFYKKGRRNGYTVSWWKNGNIRSKSNYENGILEGKQYQWYKSGEKFKTMNIVHGREEGLQQSWRRNGKLYNNYEAKSGRIFGLKRSKLCFKLDEEMLVSSVN